MREIKQKEEAIRFARNLFEPEHQRSPQSPYNQKYPEQPAIMPERVKTGGRKEEEEGEKEDKNKSKNKNKNKNRSKKYKVKKGDNLTKIAKKLGMTVEELIEMNPYLADNPDLIYAGEELNIDRSRIGRDTSGMRGKRRGNQIIFELPTNPELNKEMYINTYNTLDNRVIYTSETGKENKDLMSNNTIQKNKKMLYKENEVVPPLYTLTVDEDNNIVLIPNFQYDLITGEKSKPIIISTNYEKEEELKPPEEVIVNIESRIDPILGGIELFNKLTCGAYGYNLVRPNIRTTPFLTSGGYISAGDDSPLPKVWVVKKSNLKTGFTYRYYTFISNEFLKVNK